MLNTNRGMRYYNDAIPEPYRIVTSRSLGTWFWYNNDTYDMSEGEFATPEEALQDLLESLKPKVFSSLSWEQKQEKAKRQREEHNKQALRKMKERWK